MKLNNTITQQDIYQDSVQTNLRDIFEPNSYIVSKTQSGFEDIRTRIAQIIENLISPDNQTLDDLLNEKFLDLDFGSEFDIDAL